MFVSERSIKKGNDRPCGKKEVYEGEGRELKHVRMTRKSKVAFVKKEILRKRLMGT